MLDEEAAERKRRKELEAQGINPDLENEEEE